MSHCSPAGGVAVESGPPRVSGKSGTVALIGPPNSGKSTLFNRLTGLRQKVANYPGVTVEQAAIEPVHALKSDAPGTSAQNAVLAAAALPPGPAYTLSGTGTYRVLAGTSPVVGKGPLHRYDIEVENGITGIDLNQFAALVVSTLSDPRSWSGHGVSLQRVDSGPVDWRLVVERAGDQHQAVGHARVPGH